MLRRCCCLIVVLAACGDDGPSGGDGGVIDSPPGDDTVLVVAWKAAPAIPGGDDDNLQIATATIGMTNFRVIGDASSGDDTTLAMLQLAWEGSGDPASTQFTHAPPALYSRVEASVSALDVTGTVRESGDPAAFHVHLDPAAAIGFDVQLPLAAKSTGTIHVGVSVVDALDGVDFQHAPVVGGVIDVSDSDAADKTRIRENLSESFDTE